MASEKAFTMSMNLAGNLMSKFPALKAMISSVTDVTHSIGFDVDNSSVSKIQNSTSKVSKAIEDVTGSSKAQADAQKQTTDVVNKGADASQKHGSALDQLKGKYKDFSSTIGQVKTALTGLAGVLAGGAIAGFSWGAAEKADQYKSEALDLLSKRKGVQKIDTKDLSDWVSKASNTGYTSGTNRLEAAQKLIERGANLTQAKSGTEALEKSFFKYSDVLEKMGVNSAVDLADLATTKTIRGNTGTQLDLIFGQGFSKLSQKARAQRVGRSPLAQGIDMNVEEDLKPLDAIQYRIESIKKSVGEVIKGPMEGMARGFSKILGMMDNNPMVPKIIAIGAGFAAVGGSVLSLVAVLPLLKKGITSVFDGFGILKKAMGMESIAGALMNPYVLLIALAALILIVAYKTGVLQKAWEKFTHSAIGKDVISGLEGIATWIGSLIGLFEKWYESTGKNQMLGFFFAVCDKLGEAYDYVDKIYAFLKGGGKITIDGKQLLGGAIQSLTGKKPEEMLGGIENYLMILQRWVIQKFPFFDAIHNVLKKVNDCINWLLDTLKSMWSWLMNAIPGAKKESYRQQLDKTLSGTGVTMSGGKLVFGTPDEAAKGNFSPIDFNDGLDQNKLHALLGSNYSKVFGSGKKSGLLSEYESAPGFAEGIADAVAKGLGKLGDIIKTALSNIPGFDKLGDLATKIDSLAKVIQSWLDKLPGMNGSPNTKLGGISGSSTQSAYDPNNSMMQYFYTPGSTQEYEKIDWTDHLHGYARQPVSEAEVPASVLSTLKKQAQSHAVGATFDTGGFFAGIVDPTEEIIPQAITRRGAGPIGRALDALYGSDGARSSSIQKLEIHNHNTFPGLKIGNDMDLQRVLRTIDKKIQTGSIEAVKNAIGQRST